MTASEEYYGFDPLDGDADESMRALNEYIDLKLKNDGVENVIRLRDEIMDNLEKSGATFYGDDGECVVKLVICDKCINHDFSLEDLIFTRSVVLGLSIFERGYILRALNISVLEYLEKFDGIDSFRIRNEDGLLLDPLTLGIGAMQGASTWSQEFGRIKHDARQTYLAFNAFIGSGAAIGYVSGIINGNSKHSRPVEYICDLILGCLTYVNDKTHLPGGSIDQYLQTTRALDDIFVKHEVPTHNTWEYLLAQANTQFEGSELSREIIQHIFSEGFLKTNDAKVRRLLHNIENLGDLDTEHCEGSYMALLKEAEKSTLSEVINLLSVKLNLVGMKVLESAGNGEIDDAYAPILEDIFSHGHSIVEKSLSDAMTISPDDVGMSFLTVPYLARLASRNIPQEVNAKVAAWYLEMGVHHYERVRKIPDWGQRFSDYESYIKSGFSYLLELPGVQEHFSTSFEKMTRGQQNILVSIGMHARHIKSPSHAVIGAVLSRDLGV